MAAHPPRVEEFSSIALLGETMNTTNYFPNNATSVLLNQQISWEVQVYNHMGSVQLYQVKVSVTNTTINGMPAGPNATSHTPSQGDMVLETYRVLLNGENWNLPLQWSITQETNGGGITTIQGMKVNNNVVPVGISAVSGKSFRIVIELWSYDTETHDFIFSFTGNGVLYSVFNQIWFDSA
ncbi:MAG TPA: hypothetical protein VNA15_09205 [Candidatus Angelobacter sp.]|nr:hypothetical protein [Candidatus Angelobacter sp.]